MELTCLAFKITNLNFLKMHFLLCGCLLYIIQEFPYFCEGSAASLAEPIPTQIAQDKINVDRLLTYIVREDSQINFVTRYVPWIFSQTTTLSPKKCPQV